MPIATEGALLSAPHAELASEDASSENLVNQIVVWLDDAKAEDVVTIDLSGKSSVADFMVIASGRSDRHVGAIADQIQRKFKELGLGQMRTEGKENCDWVLLDTGDIETAGRYANAAAGLAVAGYGAIEPIPSAAAVAAALADAAQ